MPADPTEQLRAMAGVIVRVGLNLQPGQPLLITDPYSLQGVHPESAPLVATIRAMTNSKVEVLEADPAKLRALAETDDQRGFESLVSRHARRLHQHLAQRGAFLFLTGSEPQLMAGLPAERLSRFDRSKWRRLGPVIQQLIRGASQWTLAPAPTAAWADAAFADLPSTERLPALWQTVFAAMRVCGSNVGGSLSPDSDLSGPSAVAAWQTHLTALAQRRDELNAARHRSIRYTGPGTDLTLDLPGSHAWCTAQLTSKAGVPFVVNLPTEEVFTAPHKNSARGTVRVARTVIHEGSVIDGIELEFRRGRMVNARATTGHDVLQHLLATDDGANRLGEVALVPAGNSLSQTNRTYHHTLLDENAANHIALGDAYRFCSRAWVPLAINSSQIHLDLSLDATVQFS